MFLLVAGAVTLPVQRPYWECSSAESPSGQEKTRHIAGWLALPVSDLVEQNTAQTTDQLLKLRRQNLSSWLQEDCWISRRRDSFGSLILGLAEAASVLR